MAESKKKLGVYRNTELCHALCAQQAQQADLAIYSLALLAVLLDASRQLGASGTVGVLPKTINEPECVACRLVGGHHVDEVLFVERQRCIAPHAVSASNASSI